MIRSRTKRNELTRPAHRRARGRVRRVRRKRPPTGESADGEASRARSVEARPLDDTRSDFSLLEVLVALLVIGLFAAVVSTALWPNGMSGDQPRTPFESPREVIDASPAR